jgi:hypothetical protein
LDLPYRIVVRADPHRDEIRPRVAVDAGLSELAKQPVDARLRYPEQPGHISLRELRALADQERSSSLEVRPPGFGLPRRQRCITLAAADVIAAIVGCPCDSCGRQCIERRTTDPSRNQQRASIVWREHVNVTDPKISSTPTQRSRPPSPRRRPIGNADALIGCDPHAQPVECHRVDPGHELYDNQRQWRVSLVITVSGSGGGVHR